MAEISFDDIETTPRLYERFIKLCARRRGRQTGGLSRQQLFELHRSNPGKEGPYSLSTFEKSYRSIKAFGAERALLLARGILDMPVSVVMDREGITQIKIPARRSPRIEDPDLGLYEVVSRRLGFDVNAEKALGLAARGRYQIWRHSTTMPNYYSKGVMSIYIGKVSFTAYVQVIQGYSDRSEEGLSVIGTLPVSETVRGYLFPLANGGCVIIARGDSFPGFRLAIFNDIEHLTETPGTVPTAKIRSMCGYVMGTSGSNGFISPIYAERIEDRDYQKHLREVNIYKSSEIPDKIKASLSIAQATRF